MGTMSSVDPTGAGPSSLRLTAIGEPGRLARPMAVRPLAGPPPGASVTRARVASVVAGVVPGRIDFTGDAPMPSTGALPMYRHPADKNAAATSVHAGRMVDVVG